MRRTAWGLLIGGLVGTALMIGAGALAVSGSPEAGPGHEATWPAGETMSLDRVPGVRNSGDPTTTCTVTPEGQPAQQNRSYTVGEAYEPDFPGNATITCDQPLALTTGGPRTVADVTRGPLVALPLFVAFLGILFFFPRFTHLWARLAALFR